jgi:hypothetical protein
MNWDKLLPTSLKSDLVHFSSESSCSDLLSRVYNGQDLTRSLKTVYLRGLSVAL